MSYFSTLSVSCVEDIFVNWKDLLPSMCKLNIIQKNILYIMLGKASTNIPAIHPQVIYLEDRS
jgi:hypothetical protein